MEIPFWEASYKDDTISTFGTEPNVTILEHEHLFRNTHNILDIGCGDLYFSATAESRFKCEMIAVDIGFGGDARKGNIVLYNSIEKLRDNGLDAAVLMDVLEHVKDDARFLEQLKQKLRPDGTVFITVPAYQHLFSAHDVFLKHYRRYSRKTLARALTSAGFHVERMHYFYSSLYLMRLIQLALSRLRKKESSMVGNAEAWGRAEDAAVTKMIRGILNSDFALNRALNRLSPFGLSLCAICTLRPERS